jgi:hypothetical protein
MKKFILLFLAASFILFGCTKKEPQFLMRGVVLTDYDLETVADWPKMAHEAGINTIGTHAFPVPVAAFIQSEKGKKFLADCKKFGIKVEHQLHAMGQLLPRELFTEDSTMFRMNAEGHRVNDCNFCVHSEKALNIVCENAIRYARLLPSTNHRYYYWIDDAQPMCACPECSHYSESEQALIVENRIIRALRTIDPEAHLAHLAYLNTMSPPRKVKPEEGVFLEFATIVRKWDQPLLDKFAKELRANLEVFPAETAVVLEYWLDVSLHSGYKKPAVKLPWHKDVFELDLDIYAKYGIRNITSFAVYMDDKYMETYGDFVKNCLKEYGDGFEQYDKHKHPAALLAQNVLIHSHNDYVQRMPFYQAYSQQVASIEADIYAVEKEEALLVAHTPNELTNAPTLEDAYINPLVSLFKLNGGKPWRNSDKSLILLIDLKTPVNPTLDRLMDRLKLYPEVFDPQVNPNAVRVVISGNRPNPNDYAEYPSFISFDGNKLDYTPQQLEKISMISLNLRNYTAWNGKDTFIAADYKKVQEVINAAHALGKPIRFWGTPDGETAWETFYRMGIDYINTDKPEACTAFFRNF